MVFSKKSVATGAILAVAAASAVQAHSWVVCTDYRGPKNAKTFDPKLCKGWTRNSKQYNSGLFGQDVGLDTQTEGCKVPRSDSNYDAEYPMATWTPGQEVCMNWPAKNHVASSKNIHIPDGGVKIYSVPFGAADPTTNAGFTNLIVDLGVSPTGAELTNPDAYPRPGFQNCPGFLENPDKAVCSQCFEVPDLAPGKYTMQWQWVFNPGKPYVNCFEVEIGGGSGGGGGAAPPPPAVEPPAVEPPVVEPPAVEEPAVPAMPVEPPAAEPQPSLGLTLPVPNSSGACVAKANQCGGKHYTGSTSCCESTTCNVVNDYYSQCM